ncbi:polyketide synthase, partial [Mesorhizobium sp. M0772]|uniref:polyketide synthase n=1 Tax=Mesorhizobium sp. M0772 TaxID=2956998 RepID=UPI0033362008
MPSGIAIIGSAGRFPGAPTVAALWRNLIEGKRSIQEFSREELARRGLSVAALEDPNFVRSGSVLEDFDKFDSKFFGYTPRDAETMDPQHRLLLECAWQALEGAGYLPSSPDPLIGVFAGSAFSTYLLNNLYVDPDLVEMIGEIGLAIGNDKDALCSTLSYKLGLEGPSVAVQTFCSTS